MNGMTISATSNSCTIRFSGILQKAFVSPCAGRSYGIGILRNHSTCTSPAVSSVSPIIIRSSSSPVIASNLSQSDVQQRSDEWFALRKDKLTTSTFSTALGFWKGSRRVELWHEKVFAKEVQVIEASKRNAMEWGVQNELAAIEQYRKITGREVSTMGFAMHANERLDWLGASPDGLLGCFPEGGILEVKCPYNKGKPETGLPWSSMPFYYMPQVQGQMEIMDCEWVDLYCWTPNGSTIFRVLRERSYWELIHGILREFWWENVIPAREALVLGSEEQAKSYKPATRHKQTGLAIAKSINLASQAKLLCREIAGHVTEEQLAALFLNCGQVVDCRVCGDPNSVLRFAFIEFTDEDGARAALNLSGTMLGYYPVRVLPSKTAIAPVNPSYLPRSEDEREMCSRTIYCTNIDKKVTQADVKLFFESLCGEVQRLRLLGDYHHSTRIAFVEFTIAESAIAALNCSGVILGTLPIRVSPSKTPVRSRAPRGSMH